MLAGGFLMPHEYAGHYRAKHPKGTPPDPVIAQALRDVAREGKVTCSAAHRVAQILRVPAAEVGKTADLLEFRVIECQMGLFGYSPEKRIVKPMENVSGDLLARVEAAAPAGKITCATCWKIARDLGLGKMEVSAACEGLGLKVKDCQIGAF
jgi:hypothetical protein